jgi:hypothetical protein
MNWSFGETEFVSFTGVPYSEKETSMQKLRFILNTLAVMLPAMTFASLTRAESFSNPQRRKVALRDAGLSLTLLTKWRKKRRFE